MAAQSYIRPNRGLKVASFNFSTISKNAGKIKLSVMLGWTGSLQRSKASRNKANTALTRAGKDALLACRIVLWTKRKYFCSACRDEWIS